jgi:secretory phospholipase A2
MLRISFLLLLASCWSHGAAGAEYCPDDSHVLVQRLNPLPTSNGCSKPAGLVVGGEEDFTYCCDRHDACYSICGVSKQYCEKDFGKCMKELCWEIFPENLQCSQAAQMYQMGTTMFGSSGFQTLQYDFCECVPKSDVKKHYTQLLEKLYTDHTSKTASESSEMVAKLMDKAGDSIQKLGNLFYYILKKYDSAIQHEGARVGANPPSLKKKAPKQEPKQEL